MRKLFAAAPVSLLALSCLLPAGRLKAETFTFTATGYDTNTKISLSASAILTGTADPATAGAYDLTSGTGQVTLISNGGSSSTETLTLYLPSGTSTMFQDVSFSGAPFQYNSSYGYDNVVYPGGTTLNNAQGDFLDEYGLLFSTPDNHFNFFGQGGYGYTDDSIQNGSNSPLNTVALTEVTGVTPEPSSLVLLGTGLLGSLGVLRRRFNA